VAGAGATGVTGATGVAGVVATGAGATGAGVGLAATGRGAGGFGLTLTFRAGVPLTGAMPLTFTGASVVDAAGAIRLAGAWCVVFVSFPARKAPPKAASGSSGPSHSQRRTDMPSGCFLESAIPSLIAVSKATLAPFYLLFGPYFCSNLRIDHTLLRSTAE
jgi:hypothetical protein